MKRKFLIGLGVVVALFVGLFLYATLIGNKKSPAQTIVFNQSGVDVSLTYCRPYKKGRVIFGDQGSGALVTYGKYWRLGANAATEIAFAKKVSFAGKPVEAGRYRMYAIPGARNWQVVLNSEVGKWGAFEADHKKDVLSVEVPAAASPAETEQFTITLNGEPAGAGMDFVWDKTAVHVPIAPL